jgi:methylmalonyl-CoA decarboxylase
MSEHVRFERDGAVCTLRIDRPEKRNALSPAMLSAIVDGVESIEGDDDVRTLVITGTGRAFSAGFDIDEFAGNQREEGQALFDRAIRALTDFSYPTLAMINGDAIGGAVELITACDVRFGVHEARFGITPAKLGIIYGDRGVSRFIDVMGSANTKELLFTGDLVDAERAKEMGLLNHLVEANELEERTYAMAERISSNAPLSLKGIKKVIHTVLDKRSLTDIEQEWVDRLVQEAFESRDHEEAVEAFAEGRGPEFEGR